MSKNWTTDQDNAIKARGFQTLVSAAAGSGKTSVLTERVKRILCNTQDPCPVSAILVVTFTQAAAMEMKDRIFSAMERELAKSGDKSGYIRKQITLLPTADICTMDAFCMKIVKENFHLAGVSADFKILDKKDNEELMRQIGEEIISQMYEENDPAFESLTRMFLTERDDSELYKIIKRLYDYSRSYANPKEWLCQIAQSFSPEKSPEETGLTDVIYKYLDIFADYYLQRFNKCITLMNDDGKFSPDYYDRFNRTVEQLTILKNAVSQKNWDGAVEVCREGLIGTKNGARNRGVSEEIKKITQEIFDDMEDDLVSFRKRTIPTAEEHKKDCEILCPMVEKLCDCIMRLSEGLEAAKAELNAYTFNDILHKCLDLLLNVNNDPRNTVLTELKGRYREILIDEFQDTNEAQNMLFNLISRDKTNLYAVGDVKQSVYRFRLASPELFVNLKDSLEEYDGTNKPSKILLKSNFRSREGITEAVNYIFKRIMSRSVGEIDYNEDEYLNFGAKYYGNKATPDVEILCIDKPQTEDAPPVTEAQAVAEYIESVVKGRAQVLNGNSTRDVKYGDFCILLRAKKNAVLYSEALKNLGIPVSVGAEGESHEYKEIRFLISLLKVINNPLLDVSLVAVLMSPVFGFTPDELSKIRLVDKNEDLYTCLVKYSESSLKAKAFLSKLALYRNISSAYSQRELVEFICQDTSVESIYYVAGEGEQRSANIKGFVKLAEDFNAGGRRSLSEFIRYIDSAVENKAVTALESGFADDNSVKIMTVHKSKGLEFPYVLICSCSTLLNKRDSYENLILSKDTGIGIKIRDDENFTKYHTLSSVATEKSVLFGSASEELRVLYVAMTRAKEHLTFVCDVSSDSLKKKVRLNSTCSVGASGKISPYAVYRANSMSEWILSAFASHKNAEIIRDLCSLPQSYCENEANFALDVSYITASGAFKAHVGDSAEDNIEYPVDAELYNRICDSIAYEYPFDCSGILAKRTASSTEKTNENHQYFALSKPEFLKSRLTGADRGTAIHKFLECADFSLALSDFEAESQRLLESGLMDESQMAVINKADILDFLNTSLMKRFFNSQRIFKEYEFSVLKKAGDFYENAKENVKNEDIVIQGKLDLAFEENGQCVLIDYKSDNITQKEKYAQIYGKQLEIYADALTQCTGCPVKEKYIYSFKLAEFIKIGE